MDPINQTLATEFILLGFSRDMKTNLVLFVVFLLLYLVSINANALILGIIVINTSLHVPMYFFLCILSIMDLSNTSLILPKLLIDLVSGHRIISLAACAAQFYIFLLIEGAERLLLAVMAYDRYVAICHPLHYPVLMRWSNCYRMAALVWILSFMLVILPSFGNSIRLCYPNQINHYMCEVLSILQLACKDSHYSEVFIFITYVTVLLIPFMFILASYIHILYSVMKVKSAGRTKAFSTCSSHVMVVFFYFGASLILYFGPFSTYSANYVKYFSIFPNVFCPTLNPIIYSLNNKDVKEAQRKLFDFRHSF